MIELDKQCPEFQRAYAIIHPFIEDKPDDVQKVALEILIKFFNSSKYDETVDLEKEFSNYDRDHKVFFSAHNFSSKMSYARERLTIEFSKHLAKNKSVSRAVS